MQVLKYNNKYLALGDKMLEAWSNDKAVIV